MLVNRFISVLRISLARQLSLSCTAWERPKIDVHRAKCLWVEPHEIRRNVKNKRDEVWRQLFTDRVSLLTTLNMIRYTFYRASPLKRLSEAYARSVDLWEQEFMEKRVNLLGPDLAVAHFILNRGGSIKFWGQKEWRDRSYLGKLPSSYVPGYYVEALDATGTDLNYAGINTLYNLKKLKWLSLKGLPRLDDFGLDIISGRYGAQLEHLDLSGCNRITHNGLVGFYKFKNLKTLDVTGIEHTPEFKVSCVMLFEVLPSLKFKGITLPLTKLIESSQQVKSVAENSEKK